MRACARWIVVAGIAAMAGGCESSGPGRKGGSATAPVLSESAAAAAGLSSMQVSGALQLYNAKCMRCHKSYDPKSYNADEWQTWMRKMSKKAKLAPEQEELLSKYLDAVRKAE